MKHKFIIVAIIASLLGGIESKAQIGMLTYDASNMFQMLSQMTQDLKNLKVNSENLDLIKNHINTFNNVLDGLSKGTGKLAIVADIARCQSDMLRNLESINKCTRYFYSIGATPSICNAALTCMKEYKELSSDILSDNTKLWKAVFKGSKNADNSSLLVEYDKSMREHKAKMDALAFHYRCRLSQLYSIHNRMEQAKENMNLRALTIY